MDQPRELRSNSLLRAVVATLQDAGYVLVSREREGATSRLHLRDAACQAPHSAGGIAITHVRDPACLCVEVQATSRVRPGTIRKRLPEAVGRDSRPGRRGAGWPDAIGLDSIVRR